MQITRFVGQRVWPTWAKSRSRASDRSVRPTRENITDWALEQFRGCCGDRSIIKWDIFDSIYAVLHHPEYRQRYAANFCRELPRIPFAGTSGAKAQVKDDADAALKRRSSTDTPSASSARATVEEQPFRAASRDKNDSRALAPEGSDIDIFRAFVHAGRRLAEIHLHYEQQPEYPLTKIEMPGEQLDYHVSKMRLSKAGYSLALVCWAMNVDPDGGLNSLRKKSLRYPFPHLRR